MSDDVVDGSVTRRATRRRGEQSLDDDDGE